MTRNNAYNLVFTFILSLAATVFVTNTTQTALAQNEAVANPLAAVDALQTLPESDAVMFVNVRRALEAIPSVLASDPEHLARLNDKLASFTERTGIDPRLFDSVAIGVRYAVDDQALRAAALLHGRFTADNLIKAGLAYGQLKNQPQPQVQSYTAANNKIYQLYVYDQPRNDFAFAALNSKTIVAGNRAGVRAAIDAAEGSSARVRPEILALVENSNNAVVSFGGNVPASFASQVGGGQIVAQLFSNVRQFYGSTNLTETNGEVLIGLRTETNAQAQNLANQLNAFKQFASLGFLSGSSGGMLSVINNLQITEQNQDVQINLRRTFAEVADLFKRTRVSRNRK